MTGFKSEYQGLTMLVVQEFNEWKVVLRGAEMMAHGSRQFTEAKAKDHAILLADAYIRDHKHEDPAASPAVEWTPTSENDWLLWRG